MPYIEETCVAGKTFEVCKYYTYRYNAKGEKRSKKEKPTSDAQKKVNQRKADKELRRLMNANFKDGDSLVRLDFFKECYPLGSDEMQEIMKKFIRKLRTEFRKQGRELRYIYVKEIGKRGGRHIHIIMSKVDTDTLRKCWPYGGIHLDPLISGGQYANIASYFIKYAVKTEEAEGKLIGKRWYASRNLERPEPKKRVISAGMFRKSFKKMDGYNLDKESVREGISDITGYEYFSYTLIKTDNERRRRKLNPVNIYTYTNIKGLKKKDGAAWYILEVETSKGVATVGDKLQLEQHTENQAELTALLAAVRRLKGECDLHIFSESTFLAAGWTAGWIEGWKAKDWKTSRGEAVAFCEIWQELDEIISRHHTEFHIKEHHSYSGWFEFEAKRKEKKSCTRDSENSTQRKKSMKQQ